MASAMPCVELVNMIVQTQLDTNQKEIEIKNIFINIFKNGPLSNEIIHGFQQLLFLELNCSHENLNFVRQCLENVYQTLGISMMNIKK